ncbi:hypothetical protein NDN08_002363 [Rhodosorus marinus]|uniref:40S ribosomal protein S21 n=1 Tax=Rhodosorus marinus TaxID=101924 RepID=A0AAV8UXL8_9RHOD|nr:hypothetical protein NDN08_002363 [Rhodosorus marinus]
MENDVGEIVDLYIPRKCSATNRPLTAKDHASVQINIGKVNEDGLYTGEFETVAISGFVRGKGLADDALNRIVDSKGLLDDIKKK